MRKYKFARFLCWVLIVGGLIGTVAMVLLSAFGLFTPLAVLTPYLLAGGLAGVLLALVGFAFLALFDIAEHLTARAP